MKTSFNWSIYKLRKNLLERAATQRHNKKKVINSQWIIKEREYLFPEALFSVQLDV